MKRRIPQLDPPIPRRRALSAQEAELWRSVMEEKAHSRRTKETAPEIPVPQEKIKPPVKKVKPPLQPHRLDGNTRSKIHKGKTVIAATLDLHGHTVDTAHRMLVKFVARMQSEATRIVLVITGKGRAPQSGILRTQLPHWLDAPPLREQVSGYSAAGVSHGGEGAWYIKLRKRA